MLLKYHCLVTVFARLMNSALTLSIDNKNYTILNTPLLLLLQITYDTINIPAVYRFDTVT